LVPAESWKAEGGLLVFALMEKAEAGKWLEFGEALPTSARVRKPNQRAVVGVGVEKAFADFDPAEVAQLWGLEASVRAIRWMVDQETAIGTEESQIEETAEPGLVAFEA
jgi:hypothetical protein